MLIISMTLKWILWTIFAQIKLNVRG